MKLLFPEYQLELLLSEDKITVLTVENVKAYTECLWELWKQTKGQEGKAILFDGEKSLPIAKETEYVINPFEIDCNDKKILTKLYTEIREQVDEQMALETVEMNRNIILYLEKVTHQVPYLLEYDIEFDLVPLLKMNNVRIQNFGESLLEKLIEYIKVVHRICHIDIFIFVNLKQYLTCEELKQLYEEVFYEKIMVVILESVLTRHLDSEKHWILDQDLCIIEAE